MGKKAAGTLDVFRLNLNQVLQENKQLSDLPELATNRNQFKKGRGGHPLLKKPVSGLIQEAANTLAYKPN